MQEFYERAGPSPCEQAGVLVGKHNGLVRARERDSRVAMIQ